MVDSADIRITLSCGAAVGRETCDATRATMIMTGELLVIIGSTPGTVNRAPGENDWDHLDYATRSDDPGAEHQQWVGFAPSHPEGTQSLWKVLLRGCLEHNPRPELLVQLEPLHRAMGKLTRAGWPSGIQDLESMAEIVGRV